MNTLFNTDLHEQHPKVPQDTKTVAITPLHFGMYTTEQRHTPLWIRDLILQFFGFTHRGTELEEEGVKLHLCLIDTPGFGDRLNREEEFVSTYT